MCTRWPQKKQKRLGSCKSPWSQLLPKFNNVPISTCMDRDLEKFGHQNHMGIHFLGFAMHEICKNADTIQDTDTIQQYQSCNIIFD